MDHALLYQPRQSVRVLIALFASVSLHAAAVAIAQMDREEIPTVGKCALGDPIIEVEYPPAADVPPAMVEPVETPPPPPPDDESVVESTPTTPPRPIHRVAPPLVRPPNFPRAGATNPNSARALALRAPRPEYPYEARRQRLTGNGVALIAVDSQTGAVMNVTMGPRTGSVVLDQAAIAGLRRWRFKAGTPAVVHCPITFTLTGASF